MATVDMASGLNGGYAPSHWANGESPYVVEVTLDWADVLAEKGSPLAALDVFQAIDIPAGTVIMDAGVQCVTVDDATTLTLDVGTAGGNTFVDGFDHGAAAAGDYSVNAAAFNPVVVGASDDTLDVTLATLT